jgi:hypothetical protein
MRNSVREELKVDCSHWRKLYEIDHKRSAVTVSGYHSFSNFSIVFHYIGVQAASFYRVVSLS